ncbi:ABC transporter ATP-binding protein [Shouchella sp. JSM 1781072]|uniref:ABC transporter ATP-binding protein n=1 Tax=Bacillaceae TaxID=186817 RepID=UPI000C06DC46|nr:ABC transporter ATP-binding protein [Bacillus sp. Marseille-P3800]
MENNRLLEIKGLKTSFRIKDDYYAAVDNVSLDVNKNEVLGIVGESGSGKSALAFSIMGLHPKMNSKIEGEMNFHGENLANLPERKMQKLRGNAMGMIFQDPMSALNPLLTIGDQISESLYLHTNLLKNKRKEKTIELLNKVGIPRAESIYDQFPHELSGGMRQRVVIAIAISCDPEFLIADEPTTALDVTIQLQILNLIRDLKNDLNTGVILITHDLGVVAEMADRVAVMYAGQIVEIAPVIELFKNPKHPYTRSLLQSNPTQNQAKSKLHVIQGVVPSLVNLPREGCRFKERIPWISEAAHEENPELHEIAPGHFVRCSCYKEFHFPTKEEEAVGDGVS